MAEQRVIEARKLGFDTCIMPKVCKDSLHNHNIDGIKLIGVANVREALEAIQ